MAEEKKDERTQEEKPKRTRPSAGKTQGEPPAGIHQAMIQVGKLLKAVAKDRKNKQQGFAYRSIDDVYNSLQPAMADAGIYCLLEKFQNRHEIIQKTKAGGSAKAVTLEAFYRLTAADGSSITGGPIPGESFDTGDKATGKALAYAHKTFLLQTFCIPTEDLQQDPDAEKLEIADDYQLGPSRQQAAADQHKTEKEEAERNEKEKARLKGLCTEIAEAMKKATDLDGIERERKAGREKLPQHLHGWLETRAVGYSAGKIIEWYDAATTPAEVSAIDKKILAAGQKFPADTEGAISSARKEAEIRVDDIPL